MPATDVFGWDMPTVGGSSGTWGTELNALFDDDIEATVEGIQDTADAALPKAGGVMTGEVEILTERYATVAKGNLTGAISFDLNAANVQHGTVTGNTTFSFTGWPTSGKVEFVTLEITNAAAFTITWPGAVVWDGGSAPTFLASGVDVVILYSRDGGTTIRGMHAGSFNS